MAPCQPAEASQGKRRRNSPGAGRRCSQGNRCLDPGSQGESKGSAGIAASPSVCRIQGTEVSPCCPWGVPRVSLSPLGAPVGSELRGLSNPKAQPQIPKLRDRPGASRGPRGWLGTLGVQVTPEGLAAALGGPAVTQGAGGSSRVQLVAGRSSWRVLSSSWGVWGQAGGFGVRLMGVGSSSWV